MVFILLMYWKVCIKILNITLLPWLIKEYVLTGNLFEFALWSNFAIC